MMLRAVSLAAVLFAFPAASLRAAETIPLDNLSRLELQHMHAETATHHGKFAVRAEGVQTTATSESLAVVKNLVFHNGAIDIDLSGEPSKTADVGARGFVGVAFRAAAANKKFELFYIRPTNGRADDQLRRNHSTQYISFPDWPWERLRKETPGVYESYADMQPGEWTHLRIVVNGVHASLYVNNAPQPCLIVNDLKLGDTEGAIALWIGPGTEAYFRNLVVAH